jgi:hypothetical protein
LTLTAQAAKSIVMEKFKISENRFYYLYRKIKEKKTTFQDLVLYLESIGCEIRSNLADGEIKSDSLPELMIVVTPQMKKNYHKYGEFVGFDFTFNLIQ